MKSRQMMAYEMIDILLNGLRPREGIHNYKKGQIG
jgi:hypothetical protein